MATTAEGRELTQAQIASQIALGARAASEAYVLWGRLDINDLDGSTPYWLASSTIAVNRRMSQSQGLAATYLEQYRQAEIGLSARPVLAAPATTSEALRLAGPVRIKRLIGAGMGAAEAYDAAFTKYAGIVRRQTMMGGRLTIAATTGRDRKAIGWRRVTDGNPCAFCALMASRGPVYRSAASSEGTKYHGHCGCGAEPVYGEWAPSAAEQSYIDAYRNSDGTSPKQVLRSMREQGGFRDSPRIPRPPR
jgi:hypothetical protein